MPKRIQCNSKTCWNLPVNAVYVGRPSIWGNPYKIGIDGNREEVISKYKAYLQDKLKLNPAFLDSLKEKDLACWCSLNQSCHVDIILEFLEKQK